VGSAPIPEIHGFSEQASTVINLLIAGLVAVVGIAGVGFRYILKQWEADRDFIRKLFSETQDWHEEKK